MHACACADVKDAVCGCAGVDDAACACDSVHIGACVCVGVDDAVCACLGVYLCCLCVLQSTFIYSSPGHYCLASDVSVPLYRFKSLPVTVYVYDSNILKLFFVLLHAVKLVG